MAIFYFKKPLILVLSVLFLQVANAQNTPAKKTSRSVVKSAKKSSAKVTLKLDEQGRAYYFDQQGDKVVVLDYKTRRNLQAVSSYKKDEPIKDKLYSKNFYKETIPDFVEDAKPEIHTYTTKAGDTWESISLELYDTDSEWTRLKLWNEELLNNPTIPEGSIINYMDLPKK